MTAPTPVVRAVTYERDQERCVSCGATTHLEYQHRQAVGMGGSSRPPKFPDGVTSCSSCNPRYESDLQDEAISKGWKVRRWVAAAGMVPVFYEWEQRWYVLTGVGTRELLPASWAVSMMAAVYGKEAVDGDAG